MYGCRVRIELERSSELLSRSGPVPAKIHHGVSKLGMPFGQVIIQLDRLSRFGLLPGERLSIGKPASLTRPAVALGQCSMRRGVSGIFVNRLLQITDGLLGISLVQEMFALQV